MFGVASSKGRTPAEPVQLAQVLKEVQPRSELLAIGESIEQCFREALEG